MKKSLIALAVAATAGSAFAQSSVTLGGIIDQGFFTVTQQNLDGSRKTKATQFGDGSWAGSRLRFSGSENLGGGLRALFWIEQGIQPSDPYGFNYRNGGNNPQLTVGGHTSSAGQNRQSYVGLAGGFGEVRLGYIYAAAYDMWTNNGHITGEHTGTVNATGSLGGRTRGMGYLSPKFGNIDFYGTYGANTAKVMDVESTESQVNGRKNSESKLITARLRYSAGPLVVAGMFEQENESCSAASAVAKSTAYGLSIDGAAIATCSATGATSKFMGLLGEYDLKVAKVGLIHGKRDVQDIGNLSTIEASWNQLNVKVPLGKQLEARVAYNTLKSDKTGTGAAANWNDLKGHLIGLNYKLSNRTIVYGFTGSQKDTGAQTSASFLVQKETRSVVGVMHSF